jgi:polyphosphate kinase 2 (PPK2 family)
MTESKTGPHQLVPGKKVSIDALSPKAKEFFDDRMAAEAEFLELRMQLVELQRHWYADGTRKLLVVLQAMDAGGKDSTIRKVFRGINPQGVQVTSFKKPSSEALRRDYLWRIHRAVPGNGMIGVFNRSHYFDCFRFVFCLCSMELRDYAVSNGKGEGVRCA